jgi:hypothetical protein
MRFFGQCSLYDLRGDFDDLSYLPSGRVVPPNSNLFVTAQDVCPEALCVSGDAERIYQDFRFLGDGLDDVPALLFGSGDE